MAYKKNYPTVSRDSEIQAFYEKCRRNGCRHNSALMFALRIAPGAVTDREFLYGRGTLQDQFRGEEHNLDVVTRNAIKAGYKPNYTDTYIASLADYPGDPKAFVPAADARGHVKRVCEDKGVGCTGMVTVKSREPEAPPVNIPLAESIVREKLQAKIKENPDLAHKDQAELREEIIDTHGGKD